MIPSLLLPIQFMLISATALFSANAEEKTKKLFKLAESGDAAQMRPIVDNGADLEIADSDGDTPLMLAVISQNVDIAAFLIARGAKCDRTDKFGFAPLHVSVIRADLEMSKMLVEHKANVNQQTTDQGPSPLHFAAIKEGSDFGTSLMEYLTTTGPGFAPLHFAAIQRQLASGWEQQLIVEFLLDNGADIEIADSDGRTPLMLAVISQNVDIAAFLIARGAKCDRTDKFGFSLLHYSAISGNFELNKILLEQGVKVNQNATGFYDWSPLHFAAAQGHLDIVKFLVEKGRANIGSSDSDGRTALATASDYEKPDIVRYLSSIVAGPSGQQQQK